MRHEFSDNTSVPISAGAPSQVNSSISVAGISGLIIDVNVTIDIDHTWTNDLNISLEGPNGRRVLLIGREGGSGDNFRETTFDDAAMTSASGASAPFRGRFRPEENLTAFNNLDPNGTWTLHVEDQANRDGGSLNHWSLSIETGRIEFRNTTPVPIDPRLPNTVRSQIEVTDLGGFVIEDVDVTVDISHSWDRDLTIRLIGPDGQRALLVDTEGGSEDDFNATTFSDEATASITDGSPPFSGVFRPEGRLSVFNGSLAIGTWTLEIRDNARQDGGSLNSWSLSLSVRSPERPPQSNFNIEVRFLGGLTASQRSVFQLAAARWSEIIVGDLTTAIVNGEEVDDLLITARGTDIDGRGGVLGQAGPRTLRPGTFLPSSGIMSFDTADLANMERNGSLVNVIIHEMGHVIGMGTIWRRLGFLFGAGTVNPTFRGPNAMREYAALTSADEPTPVPVANTGGPGTRDGHWRESVLGSELMTGFLSPGLNPISRVTIAALEDLGYEVNYDVADDYELPGALRLAELGVFADRNDHGGNGMMFIPDQDVLPDSAIVANKALASSKEPDTGKSVRNTRKQKPKQTKGNKGKNG